MSKAKPLNKSSNQPMSFGNPNEQQALSLRQGEESKRSYQRKFINQSNHKKNQSLRELPKDQSYNRFEG